MKIMEIVSKIFGVYVTSKNIDTELGILDRNGRFTPRQVHELLIAIIKKIDERETSTAV